MISEVLRKREMQCVFQDEWFQPDTGREEKSNLAAAKNSWISVGFLYISKWFLCWMFEIILALYCFGRRCPGVMRHPAMLSYYIIGRNSKIH